MSDTEPGLPPVPLPPVAPVAPPSSVPPVPPVPPVAPTPPVAPEFAAPGYPVPGQAVPGYPSAGGFAALPPVQPKGLAIASLILGIGSIALVFLLLSVPVGIAAVITGHLAQRRQPAARGLWITGLITGYLGIVLGIVSAVLSIAALAGAFSDY